MTDANEPIPDLQELVRASKAGSGPMFYIAVEDAKRLLERLTEVTAEAERLRATVEDYRAELRATEYVTAERDRLRSALQGIADLDTEWYECDTSFINRLQAMAAKAAGGAE